MLIDHIKELYAYDRWANERLWQAVTGLDEAQLNSDIQNGMNPFFHFIDI